MTGIVVAEAKQALYFGCIGKSGHHFVGSDRALELAANDGDEKRKAVKQCLGRCLAEINALAPQGST
jgi:hypothetical protein